MSKHRITVLDGLELEIKDEQWVGSLVLPAWKGFVDAWGKPELVPHSKISDGTLRLRFTDGGKWAEPSRPPAPPALEALRSFMADQEAMRDRVLSGILKWVQEQHEYEPTYPKLSNIEQLRLWLSPSGLFIHAQPAPKLPMIGMVFGSGIDPEHGLGLLLQNGQVITVGDHEVASDYTFVPEPPQRKVSPKYIRAMNDGKGRVLMVDPPVAIEQLPLTFQPAVKDQGSRIVSLTVIEAHVLKEVLQARGHKVKLTGASPNFAWFKQLIPTMPAPEEALMLIDRHRQRWSAERRLRRSPNPAAESPEPTPEEIAAGQKSIAIYAEGDLAYINTGMACSAFEEAGHKFNEDVIYE